MKRGLLLSVLFVLVLTSSLVSANLLTDFWGKMSGNFVEPDWCDYDSDCPSYQYCDSGYCTDYNSCTPSWECKYNGVIDAWSPCGTNNQQTRTCTDANNCGTTSGKPVETQSCTYVPSLGACTPTDGLCAGGGEGFELCSIDRNVPIVCIKDTVNNCLKWSDKTACTTGYTCQLNEVTKKATCVSSSGTTAFSIDSSSPSGNVVLASGVTSTSISVVTNKIAECKYSESSSGTWGIMPSLSTTNKLSHNVYVSVSARTAPYNYYVTCMNGTQTATKQITFTVSSLATTCTPTVTSCPSPLAWSVCAWNSTSKTYQQNRSCENGCTGGRTEYQSCTPSTAQACQWSYQEASKAFCYDDGRKRILATAENAPCTGNPDNTKCSATGGWKNNVPGAQGWSCDLGSCTNSGTANACGWNGCFPEVGKEDPNCKTPDGQIIVNINNCPCGGYTDPSIAWNPPLSGCSGTQGEWKNYACKFFEPTRNLRVGMANMNSDPSTALSMAMIGLTNSCTQIQNEAGNVVTDYLLGYSYFFVPLGSSTNGPPSGWLERYNFVKALDASKKTMVLQAVQRSCQSRNIPSCSAILTDIGLIGNGNSDSSSWRQWRLGQALNSCFVYGIGSARVYGNGNIETQDVILGNAFDPTLDLNSQAFKTRCENLLRGNAECTSSNSATVCGTAKTCWNGLCCTPAPSTATCPDLFAWKMACDSGGNQTRTCGNCNAVVTEKRNCPQLSIISTWPSGIPPCKVTEQTFGVFTNRNAECRYSKTSTDFNAMTLLTRVSAERTDVGDFRAYDVPVTVGQNTFNVKCKSVDGPTSSVGAFTSGTVSFNVPNTICSGSAVCTTTVGGVLYGYPCPSSTPGSTPSGTGNGTGGTTANPQIPSPTNYSSNSSLTITDSLPLSSPALPSNTTNVTLSVTTNKAAVCKYSNSSSDSFESGMNSFSSTSSRYHLQRVSVSAGRSYTYYVICRTTTNELTEKHSISFSVRKVSSEDNRANTNSRTLAGQDYDSGYSGSGSGSSGSNAIDLSGDKVYGTPVQRSFFQKIIDFFRALFS